MIQALGNTRWRKRRRYTLVKLLQIEREKQALQVNHRKYWMVKTDCKNGRERFIVLQATSLSFFWAVSLWLFLTLSLSLYLYVSVSFSVTGTLCKRTSSQHRISLSVKWGSTAAENGRGCLCAFYAVSAGAPVDVESLPDSFTQAPPTESVSLSLMRSCLRIVEGFESETRLKRWIV